MHADATIERAAREAYGRLVAMLAARNRDIMAAEDALQDAFVAAIAQWPTEGIPQQPEAWLITVAKRRLLDSDRRNVLLREAEIHITRNTPVSGEDVPRSATLPDDRLELMLLCAHPAIDASVRAPLILQAVLGLDAGAIASAFLVPPKTMGQRLVRAKQKIRDAGMAFELPGAEVLEVRLDSLLDAIYAAYGVAWEDMNQGGVPRELTAEAMMLCDAIAFRLPDHPETLGLMALMRYSTARSNARRDAAGRYAPLKEQDVRHWDRGLIAEAEQLLRRAAAHGQLGRYQLEAAIQSAHTTARLAGRDDPVGSLTLYEALIRIAPSVGAQVAHAAATAEVHGPEYALGLLEAMDLKTTASYQAFHALHADLLRRSGRIAEAREAYKRAIGLSEDPSVRTFLAERMGQAYLADPTPRSPTTSPPPPAPARSPRTAP